MLASRVVPELILKECPDRRARERFVHHEMVQINGQPVVGRDISSKGIAVVMRPRVAIGDVVRVSFNGDGQRGPVTTQARVARIDTRLDRIIVGFEFLN